MGARRTRRQELEDQPEGNRDELSFRVAYLSVVVGRSTHSRFDEAADAAKVKAQSRAGVDGHLALRQVRGRGGGRCLEAEQATTGQHVQPSRDWHLDVSQCPEELRDVPGPIAAGR